MDFNVDESQLLKLIDVPIIDDDTNYWFVRTNGGDNFEDFYFGKYIAIGWDKLCSLEYIKRNNHHELKRDVEQLYPLETKPGNVASQISRFVNDMKIGDYILIPGANCDRIAFGIISSDAYIYTPSKEEQLNLYFEDKEIEFVKRRNVEWLTELPFERSELDPMLIPIIYSYGTIVNANPYSTFINRTLYSQYYTSGELHVIFDINKTSSISIVEFNNFINSIFETISIYSEISGLEVDLNELSIKASINSPGPVEIITCATSAFIVLSAIALFLNGANVNFSFDIFNIAKGEVKIDSPGLLDKIEKLKNPNYKKELEKNQEKLAKSRDNLKIKKKKHKK